MQENGKFFDERPVFRPVQEVPGEGTAQVGHVDADLMGAPGLQLQLHQGAGTADAQHPVMGAGGLTAGVHRPPVRGALCQADGGVYNAGGGGGRAVADGQVHPAEAPGVELELQPFLGVGVLGRPDCM